MEPSFPHQRFFLPLSPPTSSLTNHSRRVSVFDAKLSVNSSHSSLIRWEAHSIQLDRVGDQICIFGFSRGAFTARALAGMLQKVGLLPQSNSEQLPFAYAMYARDDEEGLKLSMQFKRTFSVDVKIQFLGVWYVIPPIDQFSASCLFRDTVQSVGLIPKHLPFSGSNNAIVHFRHALSLDEHRVKFIPFFCTGGKPKQDPTDTKASHPDDPVGHDRRHQMERRQHSEGSQAEEYENQVNTLTGPDSDVEEVFFAGAHCGTLRLFLA